MAELGYHEPIPGIYGTPNPATSSNPVSRAALQEAAVMANQQIKEAAITAGLYVPPGLGYGANAPEWATQPGGGNTPKIGWTVQHQIAYNYTPPIPADLFYDAVDFYDEAGYYDGVGP